MRVVALGTASTGEGYPRLDVLLDGLERVGVEVERLIVPIFESHAQKLRLAGGNLGTAFRLMPRLVRVYARLSRAYRQVGPHDAVLIGGLGHLDMLWFRCLKGSDRVPVVFDPFLGLFDTVVEDRRLARPTSLAARAFLALDRGACSRADRILVDTEVMRRRFASTLGLGPERIHTVYQGQDDRRFRPADPEAATEADADRDVRAMPMDKPTDLPTEVLFAGTYVPLQGVETILEAARLLAGRHVRFTIVGDGQARERVLAGADRAAISHVTFVHEWQSTSQFVRRMQQADICLGIFGTSRKAASVIPLKAVAALATGRPLVTRDSPAARELLAHERNAWLVPAGDPKALADAIATLAGDAALRARLARSGRQLFVERLSPPALGRQLAEIVEQMVQERKRELANA